MMEVDQYRGKVVVELYYNVLAAGKMEDHSTKRHHRKAKEILRGGSLKTEASTAKGEIYRLAESLRVCSKQRA